MSALLEGRALAKRFGAVLAVNEVDITVCPGEIHALIGPNGAGKSTLLALLAGTLRPDRGKILFDGREVTRRPVHARAQLGLARTFQVPSVVASFTVLDNVATAIQAGTRRGFQLLRRAATDRALNREALRVLRAMTLGHLADRVAGTLAHAERRLLEIAIALAGRPRIVLLDEPFAGVAPGDAERLTAILAEARRSAGLLLVEHDMDVVFRLADRVTVLVQGRCIASGGPAEVRASRAVRAAYLGDALG